MVDGAGNTVKIETAKKALTRKEKLAAKKAKAAATARGKPWPGGCRGYRAACGEHISIAGGAQRRSLPNIGRIS